MGCIVLVPCVLVLSSGGVVSLYGSLYSTIKMMHGPINIKLNFIGS